MSPPPTIVRQAFDLVDGLHALIDAAFSNDLAVVFVDLGFHDDATAATESLNRLLYAIHVELTDVDGLGRLGALFGTLEPFVNALHRLLVEASRFIAERSVHALYQARRPLTIAFAHLRTAALFGATVPVPRPRLDELRAATEALLSNLEAFTTLLCALGPANELVDPLAAPPPGD